MSGSDRASEFRILGPLAVVRGDREVELGTGVQRLLLAILLLHRGEPVSADRLADELWGGAPPPAAGKTLQVYVSRLRRMLGDGLIVRRGSGYALELEPDALDAERFERLVDRARDLRAGGDAARAAQTLRDALALWRGRPLGDLAEEPFASTEVTRLEELRVGAHEEWIDAELAQGRHQRLVPELRALVGEHPLRERLRAQLMLALYRSGRQAEALAAYREFRATLVADLGLEPSLSLRELERAILNHDPELGAPAWPRRPMPVSRRAALVVVLGGLVLAGAAGAAAIKLARGGGGEAALAGAAPDSLAVIDARSNALLAQVPVGSGPSAVTTGAGSVWVANAGDRTLARVDPATKQVVARVGLGRIPGQLAFGGDALWVASAIGQRGVVLRIDPDSGIPASSTTVRVGSGEGDDLFAPPTPNAIAAGSDGVWTNYLRSRLSQLTPEGRRVRALDLGAAHAVDGIAIGAGAVWVASSPDDRVLRVDPRSGRIVAEIPIAGTPQARLANPFGIAAADGAVWVADSLTNAVSRIDPNLNAVAATIKVGERPTRIAIGEGAVWVLNAGDGTVARIDPRRNAVTATVHVGSNATGLAAGLGAVWVTVGGGSPSPGAAPAPRAVRPLSGCSSPVHGSGVPDALVVSDLPTFVDRPAPSPVIADVRAAIRRVLQRHDFRAGRHRVAYQACDDSSPTEGVVPDRCAANARAYALNRSVIGVIGAWNSSCTAIELPTLNAAPGGPIAVISPSNTYVGLTHVGPATAADEPERFSPTGARNYVRLAGADDYQSAAIAIFLKQLGRRRLYALDDGEGTGYAGASYAERSARRLGLAVAGRAVWDADASGYRALAEQIVRSRADAVVLSGCICSNGLRLVKDLRGALGERVTLIGTDNFTSTGNTFRRRAFDGLYISGAGRPAETLPAAGTRFLSQLRPGRPLGDVDPFVAYAAQATEIMLDAIARSDGSRGSVTGELLTSRVDGGILGTLSLDANGDPVPAPIAIYRVDAQAPRDRQRSGKALVLDRVIEPPPSLVK